MSLSRRSLLRAAALFAAAPISSLDLAAQRTRDSAGRVPGYGATASTWAGATRVPSEPGRAATASYTPLAGYPGILTPPPLHFERHHSGVPSIDRRAHTLSIHGLVGRARTFSMADIESMPPVTKTLFVECAGNTSSEWRGASAPDVQHTHGLTSCSEWTGVPLSTLLELCRVRADAAWLLTEGADACRLARSLPMAKAMQDALVAYAQNGRPLRAEQGFPLRLVVPGWEGISSVKWLHRIEAIDRPAMTFWETARYSDLLSNGHARIFTFAMDVKSVITRPSGTDTLERAGEREISGLAWSGRGRIARVDITTDGGLSWKPAEFEATPLPSAHTRFRASWNWDGAEARIASRAVDDTGVVQPTLAELIAVRGERSGYHNNAIQPWLIARDGRVTNGLS